MSRAAVPEYLGNQFNDAPPGHRFSLYLEAWRDDYTLDKNNKIQAIKRTLALPEHTVKTLDALRARQSTLAEARDAEIFDAISTAPFATGLGMEHPLDNGFAFLNPYGLPYLPGSGVKGVLRAAARELASGDWGIKEDWEHKHVTPLFGSEASIEPLRRGALTFWDVIPQLPLNKLNKKMEMRVDVMTPHQTHYYQDGNTPHDSGQPTPIPFLTVPPGAQFRFIVTCDERYLLDESLKGEGWKNRLRAAFTHAYAWLGFGAKTAVGYGAMHIDGEAAAKTERQRIMQENENRRLVEEDARKQLLAQMSPVDRAIREFLDSREDKAQPEINALITGIEQGRIMGFEKSELALRLRSMMMDVKSWKPTSAAKNPSKDKDHQRTVKVLSWLAGR